MHPILFKIGDFAIYTYGLTMAMAFVIAFGWVFLEARRKGENLDDFYNVCLIALLGGVAGARILYVIVNWKEFSGQWVKIINLRQGGLVWYGGFIMVTGLVYLYTRWKNMVFFRVTDILSAPMVIGLGVGRLGCLMSGCCHGNPTSLPWGIRYPRDIGLPPELAGVKVHPSPLYEMIACFAIAGIVRVVDKRKTHDGQPTWIMFLLYSMTRFALEWFRGDTARGFVGILSTSQLLSLVVAMVSLVALAIISRKPKAAEQA